MNLVKIAEMLKSAPDAALMREMQNPSGATPSYMILSELQRRKKLRGTLQTEEPQTSVAEDAVQEAVMGAAGGLGSMAPAQAAPQGFAGGGEVKGYAAGDYIDPYDVYQQEMGMGRPSIWGYSSDVENEKKRQQLMAQGMTRAQADAVIAGAGAVQPPVVAPVTTPAAPATLGATPAVKPPVAPAGIPAAAKVAPKEGYSVEPLLQEAKDLRKQMADAYKNQADMYKQQAEDVKNTSNKDLALSLMQAGLGIAGGRSQYALENINLGAQPALQQYIGMDRERRKELQKLALGQGALGIEQLGAQMKGVTAEGELGLGGRKMDIAERSAAADEMRARAAMAGVANQAAQWKQDNALENRNLKKATEIRNYLDKFGLDLDAGTRAAYEAEYRKLMQLGTMGAMPEGVTVKRVK